MNSEIQLNIGLQEKEREIALEIFSRLLPHVEQENLVIVGGFARRHFLQKYGISYTQRPFNDLDILIKDPNDLKPSIVNDFLIHHYHLPKNSSFYAGLVDPKTRISVDIFDYFHPPIEPEEAEFGGIRLKIRNPEDQLTKIVYDLMKITKGKNISPKEFDSTVQLLQIVDLEKADRFWALKYASVYPFSLLDAIQIAGGTMEKHPERVFESPSRTSELHTCSECVNIPGFPITPMIDIFNLLGFVDKTD